MLTDKQAYVDEQISLRLHSWTGRVLLLGIVLFLFIGIADYLVTPENFTRFLRYRLGISAFLLFLFALNRLKRRSTYQYAIISTAFLASAATVELMILSFGGHRSSYYAGLNLIIITTLVLIPYNKTVAVTMATAIYAIYLVPILLFDTITDWPQFLANNIFILSTFSITLTWRLFTQRYMLNELSLQYDLAQGREQLAKLVAERTQELHQSERWHRSLFETATDGILVLDRNGFIVNANDRVCAMHGFAREALVGISAGMLEAEGRRERFAERIRTLADGAPLVYEAEHYRKDGTRIFVEVSAKAITMGADLYIQAFLRDVTEKKKIQEHLLQSQKMDSIGTLAGGIAHDFNNILTAIIGNADLVRMDAAANEKIIGRIAVIDRAARNAGRMISQLLGFARKNETEIQSLDLNDVVQSTVKLLERVLDKKIAIRTDLGADLPRFDGDVTQLEQVIMNLMVNARDAMPGGGVIALRTAAVTAGSGAAGVPPYLPAGGFVRLQVSDTGSGISEDIQGRIFEPFFTTKERGKGTGLGLAMVYGVVTGHKGYVTVQSEVGQGTTFTIYLPAAAPRSAAEARRPSVIMRGNETVLVVDDDEAVLGYVRDTLEMSGYRVLATSNPMTAVDLFRRHQKDIALVVTDVVMPLIDGGEVIRQIREVRPQTRFLTISGYSKYAEGSDELHAAELLQKPFDTAYLLTTIRRVLDAKVADR